jgi:hypothetical protein
MFRWITKSRLSTALSLLVLVGIFLLSSFFAVLGSWGLHQAYSEIPVAAGLVTALLSLIGIISTLVSARRADLRIAREFELKMSQLK